MAKIRAIFAETSGWMKTRRAFQDALLVGLRTGDFRTAAPDPMGSPDLDPSTTKISEEILGVHIGNTDGETTVDYAIGAFSQLHLLEAAARTAGTYRLSRAQALGMLNSEFVDGPNQDTQVETMLHYNDAPEGVSMTLATGPTQDPSANTGNNTVMDANTDISADVGALV